MINRITDSRLNTLRAARIEAGRIRLAGVEEQIATGKRFQRGSESPTDTSKMLRHSRRLERVEQLKRNANNGQLWTDTADQALQSISREMTRARTLAVQGANDTNGADQLRTLAVDIRAIADSLIGIANSKVLGRPVFGGTTDSTDAYASDGSYLGDFGVARRTIDTGQVVDINSAGPDVFGVANAGDPMTGDLFQTIRAMADAVEAGDTAEIRRGMESVDVAANRIASAEGRVGAVSNQLQSLDDRLESEKVSVTARVSQLRDVDLAEAVIRLSSAEASYQATLSATSRGLSTSLLDFLR